MTRSLFRYSLALLAAILSIASVFAKGEPAKAESAKPAGAAIATVNGKAIPKVRADVMLNAQVSKGRPDSEDLRKAVREALISNEVIVQEAEKKGLHKNPNFQLQVDLYRENLLIEAYLGDYIGSHPIPAEALKAEYENIKLQLLGEKEYKLRHILVEKEDEAKDIVAKLNKGAKFEDLAKLSKDPGSKDNGGDLGWAISSSFDKPFSEAITKLGKGKYTEVPIKTDYGFHIILLEDMHDEARIPPMDEIKPKLMQRMQQQLVMKHVKDLLGKAKIN